MCTATKAVKQRIGITLHLDCRQSVFLSADLVAYIADYI